MRIPKLRDWIDPPMWTDGARVEIPAATQASPIAATPVVVFPKAAQPVTPAPTPKAAAVLTGDKAEPSASLNRAAVDTGPKISVLNDEIEAKLATALSKIDEELASAAPETTAAAQGSPGQLEATAQKIRSEWVEA